MILSTPLFVQNVRERLMEEKTKESQLVGTHTRSMGVMNNSPIYDTALANSTIADLFPNCTVFFADIAG